VQETLDGPRGNAASFKSYNYKPDNLDEITPKDMSKGDLDALAAQLIMNAPPPKKNR